MSQSMNWRVKSTKPPTEEKQSQFTNHHHPNANRNTVSHPLTTNPKSSRFPRNYDNQRPRGYIPKHQPQSTKPSAFSSRNDNPRHYKHHQFSKNTNQHHQSSNGRYHHNQRRRHRFRNVDEERKFIFIHVPKTGGSSIERMLWNRSMDSEHFTLSDYFQCRRYRDYLVFGFVRNPYLRIISMFIYFKFGGNQKHDLRRICTLFADLHSLDDFVRFFNETKDPWFTNHEFFLNLKQCDYLRNDQGTERAAFIGKFEHFERDCKRIMDRIGMKEREVVHENRNPKKKEFDGLQVTPNFVQFVNQRTEEDFKLFGYEMLNLKQSVTLKVFKSLCLND